MKKRHVGVETLAPVVTKLYNKYRFGFGIHSQDAEDICGQAVLTLVLKLHGESLDVQEFFDRMASGGLTSEELRWVFVIHHNECRNYTRGSTFYRHRKYESGDSSEAEIFDLNHELLLALWVALDRIAQDYGQMSDEHDIAVWLVFGTDEDAIPESMLRSSQKVWDAKRQEVLNLLRMHLTELGLAPTSSSRRLKQ